MGNFLRRLYRERLLPTLKNGRQAIEDLAALPERNEELSKKVTSLETSLAETENSLAAEKSETTVLRNLVSDLEVSLKTREDEVCELSSWVDEEHEKSRLLAARGKLLVLLLKVASQRERAEDANTIAGLEKELKELVRDTELLKALHERTVASLKETKAQFDEKRLQLEKSIEGLEGQLGEESTSLEETKKARDELTTKLHKLESEYGKLLSDVKDSTSKVIEKLVDKGMSQAVILDLIPDVGGLFPQETVRGLESSIRRHNDEQAALLGLETLRRTPPPQPLLDPEAHEWRIIQPDFFKRIFTE